MCITSSHTSRCKVRCADDNCRTRCWDGQKTKLPPPAEMLKWTPLVQFQRWISNSFVKLTFVKAAAHSRKVSPPKLRVKAKSSLSERNYFIAMHYQAGLNFENFTEVKFRDILLTGTGRRDRRLNRDSPGQTYGRSNLNQNLKPKT